MKNSVKPENQEVSLGAAFFMSSMGTCASAIAATEKPNRSNCVAIDGEHPPWEWWPPNAALPSAFRYPSVGGAVLAFQASIARPTLGDGTARFGRGHLLPRGGEVPR